jgi:hypothetical protein
MKGCLFDGPFMTVQVGCCEDQESDANIIFIEKRWSYPVSLQHAGMLRSLGRTNNVFLTKMYDLLPDKRTKRFDRLNCYEVSIMGVDF